MRWRVMLLVLTVILLGVSARASAAGPATLTPEGAVLVDGKPFLPIFVWAQPANLVEYQRSLGMNGVHASDVGAAGGPLAYAEKCREAGMMALLNFSDWSEGQADELKDHPAVLAWTTFHEPDLPAKAGYQVDLPEDANYVWLEAEDAAESTFPDYTWLDQGEPLAGLSGGQWITAAAEQQGKEHECVARYEFEIDRAGTYTVWTREFNKRWANPTGWRIHGGQWHTTPRELSADEVLDLGQGRGVGWCRYGTVDLEPGTHSLSVRPEPGRTRGRADREPSAEPIFGLDAIYLTTGESFPPRVERKPDPRRKPDTIRPVFEAVRDWDPDALTWGIVGAGFYGGYRRIETSWYRTFADLADIISFDHYPVTGWDKPERLPEVGNATAELIRLARPGQPVWTIVEASDQRLSWTPADTRGPTPEETAAEVWSAIANGAKGIGYFTIAFNPFEWNNLTAEMEEGLRTINGRLTELAPIILSPPAAGAALEVSATGGEGGIHACRRDHEGRVYVIAVNPTREVLQATFSLGGPAPTGSLDLLYEDRSVPVQGGKFSDEFQPLAVHIYSGHVGPNS